MPSESERYAYVVSTNVDAASGIEGITNRKTDSYAVETLKEVRAHVMGLLAHDLPEEVSFEVVRVTREDLLTGKHPRDTPLWAAIEDYNR